MNSLSSFYLDALSKCILLFEELERKFGNKYMLVGSVLTPIFAEARQTQDIDILIQISLNEESRLNFLNLLKYFKFQPLTNWDDVFSTWKSNRFIQFLDENGLIKIDVNIAGINPKDNSNYEAIKYIGFDTRKRIKFIELECWIQSEEVFILSKLVYGGYQDYKDALACWIRNKSILNKSYLEKNAKFLNIIELYN